MARDFEDMNDVDDLSDSELRGARARAPGGAQRARHRRPHRAKSTTARSFSAGRVGTDGERSSRSTSSPTSWAFTDVTQRDFRRSDPTRREPRGDRRASRRRGSPRQGLLLGDRPRSVSPEDGRSRTAARRRSLWHHRRPHGDRRRNVVDSARIADAGRDSRRDRRDVGAQRRTPLVSERDSVVAVASC